MGNEKSKGVSKQPQEQVEFNPDKLYISSTGSTVQSEGTKTESIFAQQKKSAGTLLDRESIFIDSDLLVEKVSGTPLDQYSIISKLGEGHYGVVWKVRNNITANICAMKKILKSNELSMEDEMTIINEFETMKKIDHPNIIKLFQFFNTEDAYYMLMELCAEGELYYEIVNKGPFSEDATAYIMYQLFSAIFYCHSNSIIHRDLKPENLLIEKKEGKDYYRIKVCDFGTATLYEKGRIERKIIGSSYYIAPEVLQKNYDEKCDLWSCGVILYILLSGRPPFAGDTDQEVMERVRIGVYDLTKSPFDTISKEAKNLIICCLQPNPEDRISAADALKHPWFKNMQSREKFNQIVDPESKKIIANYLTNLRNYSKKNVLSNASIAYLVHNSPQLEDVERVAKFYNKIDLNEDGKISKEELVACLRNFTNLSQEELEYEAVKVFDNIDTNHNGIIEFEEFVTAAIDKKVFITDDFLKFAFKYYDKDGNGAITFDEIKQTFMQDECNRTNPDIEPLLKSFFDQTDTNKNGEISFDEFRDMMKSILQV